MASVPWLDLLLTAAVVLVVAAPMLFTESGFGLDFTNYLWTIWAAGKALAQAGHPNYFFDAAGMGVFYPWLAFDGGTLYTITGGIAELLGGHPVIAFVGVTMIAIAGDYGGTLWLGRQLGLRGLAAHAPALVVVTSAYYITNLYGRGAWAEFMAVAPLAPLIASGLHLVRTRTWRVWPTLVFVLSTIVFTGSHNITLVWGTTVAAFVLLILWIVFGAPLRLPYRRLAAVAGLGVVSVLVNAWFLLTDIAYEGNVVAHTTKPIKWSDTSFFNTPGTLLDPLRHVPGQSSTPGLFVQAPDWFMAWGLAAGLLLLLWRKPMAGALRRAWVAIAFLVGLLIVMIMLKQLWEIVPFPFSEIQFPYRLGSYLSYAVAGLVLLGALALQRTADSGGMRHTVKSLRLGLAAVSAVSLALCVWQLWVPNIMFSNSYTNRSEALASVNSLPSTWYDGGSYRDAQAPIVEPPPGRELVIEPGRVHGDRFAAWLDVPPGPAPILTNIAGGSYLVHISGLRRLGRNPIGYIVVRRVNGGSGPVYVVLETTHSLVVELGRTLSVIAILTILLVLARIGVSARRAPPVRAPLPSSRA